jgi:hypothetical protein
VPKVSPTPAIQPVGRENQPPEQQAHKGSSSFQNRLYEQVQAFLVFPWFRGQVGKEWSSGLWTFRAPQFIGKIYGSGLSVRPSPRKI